MSKLYSKARTWLLRVPRFLEALSGFRTLTALVFFAFVWLSKKMFGLDIQPTTLNTMQAGFLGIVALLPSPKGKPAWVKKTIIALSIINIGVGVIFEMYPKQAAAVLKIMPAQTQEAPESTPEIDLP